MIDRYEQLIEDVHDLRSLAAGQRLTLLLTALAVIGFVSAFDSLNDLLDLPITPEQSLAAIAAFLVGVGLWLWMPRR